MYCFSLTIPALVVLRSPSKLSYLTAVPACSKITQREWKAN